MRFSELMKNLEHEDLEFITKYGEIKEYQDEYFYTINSRNSDLMQEIKSKVSEEKPMFPYLSNGENFSKVKRPIKWDVLLSNKCEERSAKDLIGKFYDGNTGSKWPFLDKGHLVAREFQKYICKRNKPIDNFFYKNVSSNIAYQFCDKNRGNGKKRGQHQFEQAVMNWFQKANDTDSESKKVIVYYEVEPILTIEYPLELEFLLLEILIQVTKLITLYVRARKKMNLKSLFHIIFLFLTI